MRTFVASLFVLTNLAAGQGFIVVPPSYSAIDAPSGMEVAGATRPLRQQLLIDQYLLGQLSSTAVTQIAFRRDAIPQSALSGGQIDFTVTMSGNARPTSNASTVMAQNHGSSPVQVFSGRIAVPTSPAPAARQGDWGTANTIRIPLSSAWTYLGGNLCIDIVGQPVAGSVSSWLRVDAALDPSSGNSTAIGTACGVWGQGGNTAFADDATLHVGSTARLIINGVSGSPGALVLGANQFQPALDLTVIGAPGCFAYAQLDAIVAIRIAPFPTPGHPGFANLFLDIPSTPTLAGASFYAQVATATPTLEMSNGLRIDLAPLPPSLGMAMVSSGSFAGNQPPQTGRVLMSRALVVRLDWQ